MFLICVLSKEEGKSKEGGERMSERGGRKREREGEREREESERGTAVSYTHLTLPTRSTV